MKSLILAVLMLLGISPIAIAEWGIVFGADRTISSAQYEIYRANQSNFNDGRIYYRGNWYRGVIPFDSRKEANDALDKVRSELRSSSYVVNLDRWCSNPERMQDRSVGIRYFNCR